MTRIIFILSLCFLSMLFCDARLMEIPTHQELTEQADFIAILKPLKTVKIDHPFEGDKHGYKQKDFQAWKTSFEVLTVFKGAKKAGDTIDFVHFTYADGLIKNNGASFATFPLEASRRKIITTTQGISQTFEHFQYWPVWLGYLKKGKDGMYRPTVGHYDSSLSFFEMPTP